MSDSTKIAASSVPVFDGTNYEAQHMKMVGLFRFAECWDVVNGKTKKPSPPASGGTSPEIEKWNTKNSRTLGYLYIYLNKEAQQQF